MATLTGALDLRAGPEAAFARVCEVEKWPVWLAFLRSSRRLEAGRPLQLGSEVLVRSSIPGEPEQLFEIDQYIENHVISLVGAFSIRRRINFRIERKTTISKMSVRLDYPAYGGKIADFLDQLTVRRKLSNALTQSLVHFKGLVEYQQQPDALLADF
ncbi:MAG: hypothetical protein NVS1B14_08970 [Vulcanimicrobiaceae bacterium]